MNRLLRPLLIAASVLVVTGCTSKPVLIPQERLAEHSVTEPQVRYAIFDNLQSRGWVVTGNRDRLVEAETIEHTKYWVALDIPYSAAGFQIRYRDSRELGHKDGKIQRQYNQWVGDLDIGIMRSLQHDEVRKAAESQ